MIMIKLLIPIIRPRRLMLAKYLFLLRIRNEVFIIIFYAGNVKEYARLCKIQVIRIIYKQLLLRLIIRCIIIGHYIYYSYLYFANVVK